MSNKPPELDTLLSITSILNRTHEDHADDPSYAAEQQAQLAEIEVPQPLPATRKTKAVVLPPPRLAAPPIAAAPVVVAPPPPAGNADRLVFTGRMCVGKDFAAEQAGATRIGFADPIYELVPVFFGQPCDKTKPGVREFLQRVGQWGRGEINDQYPLTTDRAAFITLLQSGHFKRTCKRSPLLSELDLDWSVFGNPDFWVDILLKRCAGIFDQRIAVTNARFPNELRALRSDGWMHWHVMCSAKTWETRLAKQGHTPASKCVNDFSEKMATQLDNALAGEARKAGPKLQVIWNDSTVPLPSNRFYSLDQFKQAVSPV